MKRIDGDGITQHLSEQQLVDYVQHEISEFDLHSANIHLIECRRCAERLSSLILFAAENNLLSSEQDNVIESFLTSPDYYSMKGSFIRKAIETYKNKGFHLLKRIARKRRRFTFSFSFDIRLT